MSLLSDYHGKATRSRALGLHQTSVYIGTIAGGYFAGLVGQRYGWRWSFVVFGGLGILLGLVLRRGRSDVQMQAVLRGLAFRYRDEHERDVPGPVAGDRGYGQQKR